MTDINDLFKVDLSDPNAGVMSESFDRTPLPDGEYTFQINNISVEQYVVLPKGTPKDQREDQTQRLIDSGVVPGVRINLTLEVVDGEYAGRLVWQNIIMQAASNDDHPKFSAAQKTAAGRAQYAGLLRRCSLSSAPALDELALTLKGQQFVTDHKLNKGYSQVRFSLREDEAVLAPTSAPAEKPSVPVRKGGGLKAFAQDGPPF